MKALSDFEDLAVAVAYEHVIDKKQVGSGQARGFFVSEGIWKKLKLIQADINHALFELADAVIITASDASSYFGIDPETKEGLSNLYSANVLVSAGIMTTAQLNEFLELSIARSYPHAKATQEQFDLANFTQLESITSSINRNGQRLSVLLTQTSAVKDSVSIFISESNDETTWSNYRKVMYENTNSTGLYSQIYTKPSLKFVKIKAVGTKTNPTIEVETI